MNVPDDEALMDASRGGNGNNAAAAAAKGSTAAAEGVDDSPADAEDAANDAAGTTAVQAEAETDEERRRREEEESIELARQLMAEEAMNSYQQHFDILRGASGHGVGGQHGIDVGEGADLEDFLPEDELAAYRVARQEEEREEAAELDIDLDGGDGRDGDGGSSSSMYDAMLQLGERIGNVKEERWALVARRHIDALPTFEYGANSGAADGASNSSNGSGDAQAEDGGTDCDHRCLVCQCEYERGETLRRLPCGHCFHRDCVGTWLQAKDFCPYCRVSIVVGDESS